MKLKPPREKQIFFVSNNLAYKLWPDLFINEHGRLESTVSELIFPSKKKIICGIIYKHPGLKIYYFNAKYLTPLVAKILPEEKTCLLMGDFNTNLLNTDIDHDGSDFYDILSSIFFAPYSQQSWQKTLKSSLIIFFSNPIEINTFSSNLTLQILVHLTLLLISKDFYHKNFINSKNVFEQNYR